MTNPMIDQNGISPPAAGTEDQLGAYADGTRSSVPRSERFQTLLAGFTALAAGYLDGYGFVIALLSFGMGMVNPSLPPIGNEPVGERP
jgi:hypothetical protein